MIQDFIDFLRAKHPRDRLIEGYKDHSCLALTVESGNDYSDRYLVDEVVIPFMIKHILRHDGIDMCPTSGIVLTSNDHRYKLVVTRTRAGSRFELDITIT